MKIMILANYLCHWKINRHIPPTKLWLGYKFHSIDMYRAGIIHKNYLQISTLLYRYCISVRKSCQHYMIFKFNSQGNHIFYFHSSHILVFAQYKVIPMSKILPFRSSLSNLQVRFNLGIHNLTLLVLWPEHTVRTRSILYTMAVYSHAHCITRPSAVMILTV